MCGGLGILGCITIHLHQQCITLSGGGRSYFHIHPTCQKTTNDGLVHPIQCRFIMCCLSMINTLMTLMTLMNKLNQNVRHDSNKNGLLNV